MKRRVVLASGGTGGHFYPGLALARELRGRGWEALFLVRAGDPAGAALEREGIAFLEVDLRGMPRRPSLEWPLFLLRLARSLGLTGRALRSFGPGCVVGMGGYLTFPAALGAWRLGVPVILHESNAVLGLANRAALPLASKLALGLPALGGRVDKRTVVTGTPVRRELWSLPERAAARVALGLEAEGPVVLVFGGSQGARALNGAVPAALAAVRAPGLQCLHLSGAPEEEAVREAYRGLGLKARVRGFMEEMALAYAAADLVVCRSGASTLAELAAARRPAVLVPYPSAAAGHQEANARAFERAGAAAVLLEDRLSTGSLAALVGDLLSSPSGRGGRLAAMAAAYDALALPPPEKALAGLADLVEKTAI